MSYKSYLMIIAVYVAAVLMYGDVNAIIRAPACIDEGKASDCPPYDYRPAESSGAATERFYKKTKALIHDAVVIDMRNDWFRVLYKPEWVAVNTITGEQNYCKIRLQSYAGYAMFSQDSDWYYYLSIDEANCKDQAKLLKEAQDHVAFRSYRKITCDSGYVNQCRSAAAMWSEFVERVTAEPIDDKKIEIISYPDSAIIRKRLIQHRSELHGPYPPPIHVADFQRLDSTSCAQFELIGIICLTGDGITHFKTDDQLPFMRFFPDERLFERNLD